MFPIGYREATIRIQDVSTAIRGQPANPALPPHTFDLLQRFQTSAERLGLKFVHMTLTPQADPISAIRESTKVIESIIAGDYDLVD